MNDQEILGLRDKVAVVTGAGQGIGRAIALLLAKAGANVVAVDIDATGAKDTARAVTKLDRKSLAELAVSSPAAFGSLAQKAKHAAQAVKTART